MKFDVRLMVAALWRIVLHLQNPPWSELVRSWTDLDRKGKGKPQGGRGMFVRDVPLRLPAPAGLAGGWRLPAALRPGAAWLAPDHGRGT